MRKHQSLPPMPGSGLCHTSALEGAEAQQMPPKEPWGPESSFTWSSHEGVKLPLASGFTEPHPTPQLREEVAENQGLCEPLRILRMSHFPWGVGGLVGEEDPWKLIEKQRQLQKSQDQAVTLLLPRGNLPVPQSRPEGTMTKLLPQLEILVRNLLLQHLAQVGIEQRAGS